MKIDDALLQKRVLITCGTGGVGKTTVSAALAIRAALLGKRAVVITIDPAKRLAHSLGIHQLSDQPTDLTPRLKKALESPSFQKADFSIEGFDPNKIGTLAAIVPDTRHTFESFLYKLSSDPAIVERIKRNPIFQIFAKEFSGTNEYMALERLLTLFGQSQYDCIILDTPPSRNTLAFLDAPKLLTQFFEEKLIRWLVIPANRILAAGMKKAIGILEKLTGAGFMNELVDFATALFEVQVKFTSHLKRITEILESSEVGFLMVTAPTPDTAPEVNHFIEALKTHRFRFEGLILNRTLGYLELGEPKAEFDEAFKLLQALQAREQAALSSLLRTPIPICAKLPELARDVHSVEDLIHVALALNRPVSGTNPVLFPGHESRSHFAGGS